MRVVILAAGKGSRFNDPYTPKPLTELINGFSILEFQLLQLELFLCLEKVSIVVGFQKEKIISAFPNLNFVYNPDYAKENTAKSLLRTFDTMDEDLLWLNGDVVFHKSVLEKAIVSDRTGLIVNVGAVEDEEIKYRTNPEGNIIELSKQVIKAEGEALGINKFKKEDLPILKKHLELCSNHDYFERAIQTAIQEGLIVDPLYIERQLCTEVDFPDDLNHANQLIQLWQTNP